MSVTLASIGIMRPKFLWKLLLRQGNYGPNSFRKISYVTRGKLKVWQRTIREQPISSVKTSSLKSHLPSLTKLCDNICDKNLLQKIPYAKTYDLPVVLSTNLRALGNKTDELRLVVSLDKADVVCVIECWSLYVL